VQEHGKRLVEIFEVPAPTCFQNFRKVADCFRRQVVQVLPEPRHADLDLVLEAAEHSPRNFDSQS